MIIIDPRVELLEQGEDKVAHVARCARVCYGKESGNDPALYRTLYDSKHWSMFRHETYYAAVPAKRSNALIYDALKGFNHCPYISWVSYSEHCYIIVNGNFMRDIQFNNPVLFNYILDNQISPKQAENVEPVWRNHMRYTFKVTTQISTSRELNRCSPNNIAEQSTRYVSLKDGAIVRSHWMTDEEAENWNDGLVDNLSIRCETYCRSCERAFDDYRKLIEQFDFKREDTRGVLPLDTATTVVYTYSILEWRHIIALRSAKNAHPNATIIANMIKHELEELGYEFK